MKSARASTLAAQIRRSVFCKTMVGLASVLVFAVQSSMAASGTWTGTNGVLWSDVGNWTNTPVPGTGDTATFSGTGSGNTVISLGAGVGINTILFDTASAAGYTIGSGAVNSQTLTLDNSGLVSMSSSVLANQLFNSTVNLGTATAGTYTFTNDSLSNTLTFAGTVQGGTSGTAAAKTLTVGGAGNTVISGNVATGGSSSLAVTKVGTGMLTLSAATANTFAGLLSVSNGTLRFSNTNQLGTNTALNLGTASTLGTLSYTGATVTLSKNIVLGAQTGSSAGNVIEATTAGQTVTLSGIISGGAPNGGTNTSLTLKGPGAFTPSNTGNTFTGNILVDGATFNVDNFRDLGLTVSGDNMTTTLVNGAVLNIGATLDPTAAGTNDKRLVIGSGGATVSVGSTFTYSLNDAGQFGGTGDLTKTGAGTLLIGGTSVGYTYTGTNVNVNAGILTIGNSTGLGTAGTINIGDTTGTATAALQISSGTVASTTALVVRGGSSGVKTIRGTNTTGTTAFNGGVTLNSNVTVDVASGGTLSLAGGLDDGGVARTITKTTAGTLSLGGTSNLAAGTNFVVSAGVLNVTSTGALGSNAAPITLSGASRVSYGAAGTYNNNITMAAGTGISGAGVLSGGSGTVTYNGTLTINGDVGAGGHVGSTSGTLVLNGPVVINSPTTVFTHRLGTVTYNTVTSGTAVNPTFSISAGTGNWGIDNVIGAGSGLTLATVATGTLNLNGFNQTFSSIVLGGAGTFVGTIASGTGTLTLGGNVSNDAASTGAHVFSGKLDLGGVTRTFTLADASAATLELTINSVISNGGINKAGAGTLVLAGANTFAGKTTVTAGLVGLNNETGLGAEPGAFVADQLTLNGGGISALSTFTINDPNRGIQLGDGVSGTGTIDVVASQTLTINNVLTGTGGSLIKTGAGTLILGVTPTYTGSTTINGGAIGFQPGAALPANGLTIGASGSTLQYYGSTPDITAGQAVALAGTLTVDVIPAATTVTYSNASSLGGGGAGGLTKMGAGTLILAGGNATYTGATTAGAGTLQLNFGDGSGATVPASNVINTGSALVLQGGTVRLNGMTTGTATANSQTFAGTSLTAGGSVVTNVLGTATSVTANLGVISARSTGATVQFAMPSATTTLANVSTTPLNTASILGGWATYGTAAGVASDWAAKDGSNNIIALAAGSYTTLSATNGTTAGVNTNFTLATGASLAMTSSILANTLRIASATTTVALGTNTASLSNATGGISSNVGAGGILYSPATGTGTISGTTTTTSTGFVGVAGGTGDLPIFVSTGGTLTISAGVGGTANGFGITKSGGGTLNLTNAGTTANNYTGQTVINGGILSIDSLNRIGATSGITLNGGAFQMASNISLATQFTLGTNGGTINYTGGAGNATMSATSMLYLGSGSRSLTFNNNNASRFNTFASTIADSGGPTSVVVNASGDVGLLQFTGANNVYSGATTINRGVLRIGAATSLSANSNLVFAGTGTNRAILESSAAYSSFTSGLGTGAGQVQWTGNGGFNGQTATFTVNIGGQASPTTLVWNTGGFVPTGFALQFAQAAGNVNYGTGTVDFKNPIDLNGGTRDVNVADNGGLLEVIMNGAISSSGVNGVFNKTGVGTLKLNADSSASTNTALSLAANSGYVVLANANAIPGSSGANVTINAGSGLVLTGSTNPLATIGSRIVTTSAGSIALDVNSSANVDFTGLPNLALGALNTTLGQPIIYTGTITPAGSINRIAPGKGGIVNGAATTGNTLVNMGADSLTNILLLPNTNGLVDSGGARSLVIGSGATYLTSYNTYTGGTSITGSGGNATIGFGNDAALGAGLVTFSSATASTGYIGALNGDHTMNNNVSIGIAGNWVASADAASDGVTNAGSMTYTGTVAAVGLVNIYGRTRTPIILGNLTAGGTITINNTVAIFATAANGGIAKTHTQATTLADSSTLLIDSANSLGAGTGTLTMGSGTLRLQPGSGSASILATRSVAVTADKSPTFNVWEGDSLSLLGPLTGGGSLTANRTFLKNGAGALTLAPVAVLAYQAQTGTSVNTIRVDGGSLVLDASNITATGSIKVLPDTNLFPLILGNSTNATYSNGGTLKLVGNSLATKNVVQGFGALTLTSKDNAIVLQPQTGGGTVGLSLTSITSPIASTVALTMPANSSIAVTTGGTGTANTILQDAGGNAFAVIGTTAGSITDWAARNAATTNYNIVTGTTAGIYTPNTGSVLSGNADMSDTLNTTTTLGGVTTLTSLRFNNGGANFTIDTGAANTLTTGGILVGANTGVRNSVIQGSAALMGTGGTVKQLLIYQGNVGGDGVSTGLLTIDAPIADNGGASALVKSGPGTVVLGGNNSFTSSIYLNGGVLSVATAGTALTANPLGQMVAGTTNIIFNGGSLRYTGAGSAVTDRGFTFNMDGNVEVSSPTGALTVNQVLTGIAGTPGLMTKTGAGTLTLGGSTANSNLGVMVGQGTLNLEKSGVNAVGAGNASAGLIVGNGATAKITGSGGDQIGDGSSVVLVGTGTLDLNANSETIDALSGNGVVTNTGGNGTAVTLTLGSSTNNTSNIAAYTLAAALAEAAGGTGVRATGLAAFSGTISDNGANKLALTKGGAGTQTLSYIGGTSTYTYSGDTTINSGTLMLRSSNLLPVGSGKGNVQLSSGVLINGVTVPAILDAGGFDQSINGLTGTTGSVVTNTPLSSISANQTNTLTVGGNDQSSTFAGIFQDGYVIKPGTTPQGFFGFLAVTKTGAGVLTLTGANTATGMVSVNNGRIDLNNTTGNALATNVTVNTGGTLKLLANNQILDAKTVTTAGGTFDLNGFNETVGVTLTGGSIVDGVGGGSLSSGSAFNLQAGTVSAKLSGASGLSKTTAGTVVLSGGLAHDFAGIAAISAGTLEIASGASISASSGVALTGTGTLRVNGSTGALVPVNVGANATLSGAGTVNGVVTVAANGIIEAGNSGTGNLSVGTLNFSGAAAVELFNIDQLTASIVSVLNTMTTTSGGGNAVIINATNAGSIANTTGNGYLLLDVPVGFVFGPGNNNFVLGSITGLGGRQSATLNPVNGDGLYVQISGVNPYWVGEFSGEWSANIINSPNPSPKNWKTTGYTDYIDAPVADTVLFDDNATGTTLVDIAVADVHPNGVTFNNSLKDYTLKSTGGFGIAGGTSLVKSGAGTLTIENANTFDGGVVINGGVVKLANANALGINNSLIFGPSVPVGTKLQLNGRNATVTGLATNAIPGSPVVENGDATTASTLTVNLTSGSNTYAGVLQNGGAAALSLVKQGGGTLILTGTNTATGGNTVSGGVLQIGSGGATGSLAGATTLASGTSLVFNRSGSLVYAGGITGAGALAVQGGGTIILSADAAHSGGTSIATGTTLQVGNGGATGALSGTGAISDSGLLSFNRTGSSIIQGNISGTGALEVMAGTLILTGSNIYSGSTTIDVGGSLQIGNGGTSGTLGTGSITDNGELSFNRTDSVTVSGGISGTGTLHVMDGLVTLTGANTYSGGTQVDSGSLLVIGNGATGSISGFDGASTNNVTVSGTGVFEINRSGTHTWDNQISGTGNVKIDQGVWTFTTTNAYSGTTTILNGATLNVGNGGTTGTIGTGSIVNAGTLAFNRTDSYILPATNTVTGAGAVVLANTGTVATTLNGQFNTTGQLRFGGTAGSTIVSTLDLSNGGGTFGGLLVQTNSATANTITVGSGYTLQVNGAVTIGYNSAATSATKLTIGGAGTFNVGAPGSPTNATFLIGNGQTTNVSNGATLDLSGISSFYANLGTGTLRVGDPTNSGGTATAASTLILAPDSTIIANLITQDSPSGGLVQTIKLGTNTNVFNANTIEIGGAVNRGAGLLNFSSGTGTLQVRNLAGSGRAAMTVAAGSATTGAVLTGTVDLTGHSSDLLLSTLSLAVRSAGGGTAPADGNGAATATFSFDTGTLDVLTVNAGGRSGTNKLGVDTANVNLGGGTVTIGTLNMASNANTSSTATTGGSAISTVDIFGTTAATIGNISMSATSGSATNVATSTLLIRGTSTVTVNGDITRTAGPGTENTTVTLNGGTLDMTNHNIGSAAAPIGSGSGSLNFQAGTLKNVAAINGTGGLNKTTAGTLILEGANTYSGPTVISAGTLQVGSGGTTGTLGTDTGVISNSGTLAFNRSNALTVNNVISGTGAVNQVGSGTTTLTATNLYSGGTTISGGTLLVNNTGGTGSGAVTLNSAGTLGGTGTLAPTGSNNITLGGMVAPGSPSTNGGVGTLSFTPLNGSATFTSTGSIDFQLSTNGTHGYSVTYNPDGTINTISGTYLDGGNDRLLFNGGSATSKLDLSAVLTGNLNLLPANGYSPMLFDLFDLLDWANTNGADHASAISGLNVSQLDLPSLSEGLAWDTSKFTTYGVVGVMAAIPEPSRVVLLLLGMLSLVMRRRRSGNAV